MCAAVPVWVGTRRRRWRHRTPPRVASDTWRRQYRFNVAPVAPCHHAGRLRRRRDVTYLYYSHPRRRHHQSAAPTHASYVQLRLEDTRKQAVMLKSKKAKRSWKRVKRSRLKLGVMVRVRVEQIPQILWRRAVPLRPLSYSFRFPFHCLSPLFRSLLLSSVTQNE